ncbi:hypothetical protein NCS56_01177100 [Fusarium sp. Ph1]|nr:hypothetical protein NCS56_01177100 [Fusarium sp. Ph1]
MNSEFRPKLAPTKRPLTYLAKVQTFVHQFIIKDSLKPRTTVLIGSIFQLFLSATLPFRWAVVPSAIVLLNSIITTVLQLRSPKPNEYTTDTVPGRTTAQLPFRDGTFGNRPGASPVVVFNIGVQSNHPLGVAAPHFDKVGDYFRTLHNELTARRDELGMLSYSNWRGDERSSNNTLLLTYSFRDVESLNRFAHEELHRKAWDWMNKEKPAHIGIFHETFCVPAHAYETIYVNCHPVLMGRATVKTKGEEETWMNSLVSADVPALKTQWARLSRDAKGNPREN